MSDTHDNADREHEVDEAIAAYLEAERTGNPLDPKQWLADHADLTPELESFLQDRACFEDMAAPLAPPTRPPAPLEAPTVAPGESAAATPGTHVRYFGDYELLEEIARGGMGV